MNRNRLVMAESLSLPKGMYEGMTASAHDVTKLNALSLLGSSKSSKNMPPMPRRSPEVLNMEIILFK